MRLADLAIALCLCTLALWIVPLASPTPARGKRAEACYSNTVLGLAWDCKFGWLDDGAGLGNYNYDFPNRNPVSWDVGFPDAVLFYNYASTTRIVDNLPADWSTNFGGIEVGSVEWGLMRSKAGSTFDWGPSKGFKNHNGVVNCGTTAHIRPYAPPLGVPYMFNAKFGYFVFATAHNDHNEICLGYNPDYGNTEAASDAVGLAYNGKPNFSVHFDWGNLHNREAMMADYDHIYNNDGKAVYINMK
jgi:hypothetical protein